MLRVVSGLSAESDFPYSDISSTNADMLAVMLANEQFFAQVHRSAESIAPLYRKLHSLTMSLLRRDSPLEPEHLSAVAAGISTYECASVTVNPLRPTDDAVAQHGALLEIMEYLADDGAYESIGDLSSKFAAEQPQLATVVGEVNEHFSHGPYSFALWGAALLRRADMNAVSTTFEERFK